MKSRITKTYLRQTQRGVAEVLWNYLELPEEAAEFDYLFLQLLEFHLVVLWSYRADLDRRHYPGGRWAKSVTIEPPPRSHRSRRRVALTGTVIWGLGTYAAKRELAERFRFEFELERTPSRRDRRRYRLVGEVRSLR